MELKDLVFLTLWSCIIGGVADATSGSRNSIKMSSSCPPEFPESPLIILSMDGFRADYLEWGVTPTLKALSMQGVKAPFIKPSYPSITFPNHYTIVTGLLPPYHGVVANSFYDQDLNATFRLGREEFFQKRFWGGEPIWVTAEKQGKIAGVYFWPGSETEGLKPTYWLPYNESHTFNARADEVLNWLDLPAGQRPDIITFYLHEPDRQGHEFGPNSHQVVDALRKVDDSVQYFIQGLQERDLYDCVNLVLLSDHGMASAGKERLINLKKLVPDVSTQTRFFNGVFPRIQSLTPSDSPARTVSTMGDLACKFREMRVYHKNHAPVRWHLSSSRRIEDVILDLDPGFQVDFDGTYKPDKGDHGYDNVFHLMNAVFMAVGPAFKQGIEVESFQNVELYNLFCVLLGVSPAQNNGTWGALHHLLTEPPSLATETVIKGKLPAIAKVPKSSKQRIEESEEQFIDTSSEERFSDAEDLFVALRDAENHSGELLKAHLPWGIPHTQKEDIKLLLHEDHVTGYSEDFRSPLWVSFHLGRSRSISRKGWVPDVRIRSSNFTSPGCDRELLSGGLSCEPLFHPDFSSSKGMKGTPFLSTNAVPITKQLRHRWSQLRTLLRHWGRNQDGGINVVMGTVFDFNYDTLANDFSKERLQSKNGSIPTHLFAIATRCLGRKGVVCPHDFLDLNAFIFPMNLPVSNCMGFKWFAREFSAKLDDVQKITGMTFFPKLAPSDRIRLLVRLHSNLWGLERWENRIRSDAFGLKK